MPLTASTAGVILKPLPLLFTTAALTLLYALVPARPVPWRNALAGAALAALAFEAAKHGFAFYVTRISTYELVYGTLAALPVFLIWIYLCWLDRAGRRGDHGDAGGAAAELPPSLADSLTRRQATLHRSLSSRSIPQRVVPHPSGRLADLAADLGVGDRAGADLRAPVVAAAVARSRPPGMVERVLAEYRQAGATPGAARPRSPRRRRSAASSPRASPTSGARGR